jgi:hypothetical protein
MSLAPVLNFDRVAWRRRWAVVVLLLPVFLLRPAFGAAFLVHDHDEHDSHAHSLVHVWDDLPSAATTTWHAAQHGDDADADERMQSALDVVEGALILDCSKVDSTAERVGSETAATAAQASSNPWDGGAIQIGSPLQAHRSQAGTCSCCPRPPARHAAAILLKSHALLI